jgi:hypothetical protein
MTRYPARLAVLVVGVAAAAILGPGPVTEAREIPWRDLPPHGERAVPRAAAPETFLVIPPATPLLHLPSPATIVPPPASGVPSLRPERSSPGHVPFVEPGAPASSPVTRSGSTSTGRTGAR